MKTKKFKLKKNIKKLILVVVLVLFVSLGIFGIKYLKDTKIDRVLKTESYSYLPVEAQNYIKEIYEETGEIILTEKNKIEEVPYLNPAYVEFLETGHASEYGYIPEEFRIDHSYKNNPLEDKQGSDDTSEIEARSYYNLRDEGYITNVYDQGSEGLCWAFASSTSLESHLAIKTNKEKMLTFSEKQIDYATTLSKGSVDAGENPYITSIMPVIGEKLNEGGNLLRYLNGAAVGISPIECKGNCSSGSNYNSDKSITEDKYWKYPYEYNGLLSPYEIFNNEQVQYSLNEALFFNPLVSTSDSEVSALVKILKNKIVNNGSVYVGVGAYTNFSFEYTPTSGEKVMNANGKNIVYYIPWSVDGAINHAVSIIGWDDNYTHKVCLNSSSVQISDGTNGCPSGTITKTINGAWIIQNSWGNSSTYIYLPYDSLESSFSSISEVEEVDYDNTYRSDGYITFFDKGHIKEKLTKVKFFSSYYNTTTKIVYKESTNEVIIRDASAPYTDGVVLATVNNTYPGLYTVDVSDKNIILEADQIRLSFEGDYGFYKYYGSMHTTSVNEEDKFIDLSYLSSTDENVLDKCTLNDNKCISEPHVLEFTDNNVFRIVGIARNLNSNDNLVFKVLDSNGNDVTSKFHIFRNFVVNNVIEALISYDNTKVSLGNYTVEVYYNGVLFDSVIWKLTAHNNIIPGIGTELNPHKISTAEHLNDIRNHTTTNYEVTDVIYGYYELANDLDLLDATVDKSGKFYNSGQGWDPIYKFAGNFDGKGHAISGLYINRSNTENNVGLFGTVFGFDNYFRNIILKNPVVVGTSDVGSLIGGVYESRHFDLHDISVINGSITSSSHVIGGIVGKIKVQEKSDYHFYNLFNNASVGASNANFTGGLIGVIERDTALLPEYTVSITNSVNLGNVYGGAGDTGGIVSEIVSAKVINFSDIISAGTVKNGQTGVVGDILGSLYNNETLNITNSYYLTRLYGTSITLGGNNNINNNTLITFKDLMKNNYIGTFSKSNDWINPEINGIKRIPMLKSIVNYFDFTESIEAIEMKINETFNIKEIIRPDITNAKNVSFAYDKDYLTISSSGVITPVKAGTSVVTIDSKYDGYSDDINVTVKDVVTITYHSNDSNNTTKMQVVDADTAFKLDKNEFVSKESTFKNWNTWADGTGTNYLDEAYFENGISEDLDLYALWDMERYKITLEPNGGEGEKIVWDTYYPESGYLEFNNNIFKKENSIIESWNTEPDGSGSVISAEYPAMFDRIPFDENNEITLYAQWGKANLYVYFDPNFGKAERKMQTFKYGEAQALQKNTYNRTGYSFKGWNTKADGSGQFYSDEQEYTATENNVVLYAQWEANKYTVKFVDEMAEGSMDDQIFTHGVSQALSENKFTKQGYKFIGWNTKADGSGTGYTDKQEITVTSNMTLYAQWTQNIFYVVFDQNGGEGSMEVQEFEKDVPQKLSKVTFIRDGYQFAGWITSKDNTVADYNDEAEIVVNQNITLYALWTEVGEYEIKEYTVDKVNMYIDRIPINTTFEEFSLNFTFKGNGIVNSDFKTIGGKNLLYTGGKSRILFGSKVVAEYTNVVRGDVNGDAKIGYADYVNVYNHIEKSKNPSSVNKLLTNEYFLAGDMSLDGKIGYADYVQIYNKIQELKGGTN